MSLPALAPDVRPRTGWRTIVAAGIAGVVTLCVVIGGGITINGGRNYRQEVRDIAPYASPSDAWSRGAAQQWASTIAADAQVLTTSDHVLSLEDYGTSDTTMTAYAADDDGLTRAWTASLDTSGDTDTGASKETPPTFLLWGENTLIHGTTLYNISTGATGRAPWAENESVVVAGDTAIACDSGDACSAYSEESAKPRWSTTLTDASDGISRAVSRQLTVYQRERDEYAIVGFHAAVNLTTGKEVKLNVPMDGVAGWAIACASDGWLIRATADRRTYRIFTYSASGGDPTGEIKETLSWEDDQMPVYAPAPRKLSRYKALWENSDKSDLPAEYRTDSQDCVEEVDVLPSQATITVPDLTGEKVENSCLKTVRSSPSGRAVTVGPEMTTDLGTFSLMFDGTTGRRIDFAGLDPDDGAVFDQVSGDAVIGYSPADGTLIRYTPASR